MGSKQSTVENNCVEELNNINEEDLDISRIDKLQIKAIKEMNNKIKKLNKEKTIVSFTNYQFKFVITVCFDLVILYWNNIINHLEIVVFPVSSFLCILFSFVKGFPYFSLYIIYQFLFFSLCFSPCIFYHIIFSFQHCFCNILDLS